MPFELVYENDFSAPLGAEWFRYKGVPACCPTSKWDEQNAVVQNGTRHRWANRSSEPCTLVVCIVGAARA